MALYLVRKKQQTSCTRYTVYEAQIEAGDVDAAEEQAKALRTAKWGNVTDEWLEDDYDEGVNYEVIERLDRDPDEVQGEPADFGLAQEPLIDTETFR